MAVESISLNIFIPEKKKKVSKSEDVAKVAALEHPRIAEKSNETVLFKDKKNNNQEERRAPKQKKKSDLKSGKTSSLFDRNVVALPSHNFDVQPIEEPLFSKKTFDQFGSIHPYLVANLQQLFQISIMTVVQKLTMPVLLSGKDALVRSQTGSGKTLAYAVPVVHTLQEISPEITRSDGIKALIVLPTRELALQTYECFQKLLRAFTRIVPGLLVGGEKRKSEKARLRRGVNILVGTPGRLLDHATSTKVLSLHTIDWLILDEADKLLDMGYEKHIRSLVTIINSQRENESENIGRKQTVLLSATLTSAVQRLAGLTLNNPQQVDASISNPTENDILVIPQTIKQKYVVTTAKLRLVALTSFIIHTCEIENTSKMLIFMATQDMVDYYTELISTVITSNVTFFKLHGNMTQSDRVEVFKAFRKAQSGVLFCTDVGARGLDLPQVDWIVQFTAPSEPAEYVHRVGRTARVGASGSALLFLIPSELPFVEWLQEKRIKLEEENVETYLKSLLEIHLESKNGQNHGGGIEGAASILQDNFEQAVLDQHNLHQLAAKAYRSWVRFYASYPKESMAAFHYKGLHLGHHAKCFALRDPPTVIGGIGKPTFVKRSKANVKKAKNSDDSLGLETQNSRNKRLLISEFESGLSKKKKRT